MEEEARDQQEAIISIETIASSSSTMDPPESPPRNLDKVQGILGYNFKDKNLLEGAFTHPSYNFYARENYNIEAKIKFFSYERLGYLGDAVLNLLVTKEQFFLYPNLSSGQLTRLRGTNVDTEKLARVAIKHGLHCYLRHKKPLLEEQIIEFERQILEYPTHSNWLINVPKVLADLVESIVGAIFIDSQSNIDIVWQVVKRLLEPMIDAETLRTHPVTELYEVCQKNNLKLEFEDSNWEESMAVDVLVDDQLVGRGIYGSKKEIAQNRAAQDALQNIPTIFNIKENSTLDDNIVD